MITVSNARGRSKIPCRLRQVASVSYSSDWFCHDVAAIINCDVAEDPNSPSIDEPGRRPAPRVRHDRSEAERRTDVLQPSHATRGRRIESKTRSRCNGCASVGSDANGATRSIPMLQHLGRPTPATDAEGCARSGAFMIDTETPARCRIRRTVDRRKSVHDEASWIERSGFLLNRTVFGKRHCEAINQAFKLWPQPNPPCQPDPVHDRRYYTPDFDDPIPDRGAARRTRRPPRRGHASPRAGDRCRVV